MSIVFCVGVFSDRETYGAFHCSEFIVPIRWAPINFNETYMCKGGI